MRTPLARLSLGVALILVAPLAAQQRPSPEQARALLARPEIVQQLRQQLSSTGMNRDQVRARLRAEGYPENLLDSYLPGSTTTPEAPTADLYAAIQELGIADSDEVSVLRMLQSDTLSGAMRDSLTRLGDMAFNDATRRQPFGRRVVIRSDVADSIVRADSGYNVFGFEVFRTVGGTRLDAANSGPVDAGYRLGPGDQLVLILTGDVETSMPLAVTREGFVLIPQVGTVQVANLTLAQLTDVLYTRLGRVYSGVRRGATATTQFSVTVSRLRTNQVYVMGEVIRPASYMMSSAGTALSALYLAGGPTPNGSMRQVEIRRAGRTVATVDLYDYLVRGDASKDVRLEMGDIVFVPPRGPRVRIVGEVIRPGTYELKPGESLASALASAGGFTANARQNRVQIERILPAGERRIDGRDRTTLDVTSADLASSGGQAIPLAAGDVVRVFEVAERVRNTVRVEGHVWNPGAQGLGTGLTVSQALRLAGGLKPDAYLGQVLVSRLDSDSTRTQLRVVLRDTTGTAINDLPLREDDVVQVFSVTTFRPERYVAIGGAVRHSGRFPYRRGMTVRDLVLLSGGLTEGAYLSEAEIARLPAERTGTTTATTMRIALDSTYLFDRMPGSAYPGAPGLPAAASGAPEIELQPYDNVLIMQQPSWELQRVVTLSGEVKFPGQYSLVSREERLADLIDRAGGFTAEAYPEGTVFTREQGGVGRVAIDVPSAMRRRSSSDNLLLIDADRIAVPRRPGIVTVQGAVNAPNVVAYVPGKNLRYYVRQAGGPTRNADYKRAFVTQPSGMRQTTRSWWLLPDGVPDPLAGAVVVVPERSVSDRAMATAVLSALPAILTAIGTIIIASK